MTFFPIMSPFSMLNPGRQCLVSDIDICMVDLCSAVKTSPAGLHHTSESVCTYRWPQLGLPVSTGQWSAGDLTHQPSNLCVHCLSWCAGAYVCCVVPRVQRSGCVCQHGVALGFSRCADTKTSSRKWRYWSRHYRTCRERKPSWRTVCVQRPVLNRICFPRWPRKEESSRTCKVSGALCGAVVRLCDVCGALSGAFCRLCAVCRCVCGGLNVVFGRLCAVYRWSVEWFFLSAVCCLSVEC